MELKVLMGKRRLADAAGYSDPHKFSKRLFKERNGLVRAIEVLCFVPAALGEAWQEDFELGERSMAFWLAGPDDEVIPLHECSVEQFKSRKYTLHGYRDAAVLFGNMMSQRQSLYRNHNATIKTTSVLFISPKLSGAALRERLRSMGMSP